MSCALYYIPCIGKQEGALLMMQLIKLFVLIHDFFVSNCRVKVVVYTTNAQGVG
jgi:hypothetical protein